MAGPGRIGRVAAFAALACWASPALGGELVTKIDLDYTYEQKNLAGDVTAATTFEQKYAVTYLSTGAAYEYGAGILLELEDSWYTRDADFSRVSPTLEIALKGAQSAFKASYESVISTTRAFEETPEATAYSNNFEAEFEAAPTVWPEIKLKFLRRRDYQEQTTERVLRTLELTALKDFDTLRLEYNVKRDWEEDVFDGDRTRDAIEWTGKATLRETLWADTEWELAYEVKEQYGETFKQSILSTEDETYTQKLRSKLRNLMTLTPRLSATLQWEYEYEEDLLELEYDFKLKNQYGAALRYDLSSWVRLAGELKRKTEHTRNLHGFDDEESVNDSAKFNFDAQPVTWLRLVGSAVFERDEDVAPGSGGTVDRTFTEKYEAAARNKFREFWELTLAAATKREHTDGWLTKTEAKLKTDLRLRFFTDLLVQPSFESTRINEWQVDFEDPERQQLTREGKLKVEYRRQFFGVLQASFSHTYTLKKAEELDAVLNFDDELTLNEDTRLNLVLLDLVPDLRVEGEVSRKATDTAEDPDPMLVEVTYLLKFDWKRENLGLLAAMMYNDKGEDFDDLVVNGKVEWRGEQLQLSGEYQFEKKFADETDEKRTLNLKLVYKF